LAGALSTAPEAPYNQQRYRELLTEDGVLALAQAIKRTV